MPGLFTAGVGVSAGISALANAFTPTALAASTLATSDWLLQFGGSDPVRVALQAYEMVGAVLGVVIAYLAYRGYRRNDSRPMLFISLGFVLVLGVPLVIVPVYFLLPVSGGQRVLQAVVQTLEVAGLLCIIYALRA